MTNEKILSDIQPEWTPSGESPRHLMGRSKSFVGISALCVLIPLALYFCLRATVGVSSALALATPQPFCSVFLRDHDAVICQNPAADDCKVLAAKLSEGIDRVFPKAELRSTPSGRFLISNGAVNGRPMRFVEVSALADGAMVDAVEGPDIGIARFCGPCSLVGHDAHRQFVALLLPDCRTIAVPAGLQGIFISADGEFVGFDQKGVVRGSVDPEKGFRILSEFLIPDYSIDSFHSEFALRITDAGEVLVNAKHSASNKPVLLVLSESRLELLASIPETVFLGHILNATVLKDLATDRVTLCAAGESVLRKEKQSDISSIPRSGWLHSIAPDRQFMAVAVQPSVRVPGDQVTIQVRNVSDGRVVASGLESANWLAIP